MSFYAQYPASASGNNASVGSNGTAAPSSSTEIGFIDGSGNLQGVSPSNPLPTHDAAPVLPSGGATAANQVLEIADLDAIKVSAASIDAKLTNPLPVSGPLTDVQLRASVVPVSLFSTTITGSVAVTGALTDTELRATPVPVSGTVSTGGLTDAELRATPVPISGTVTANAGTGTFAISAASLPLPTGAATETTLAAFSNKSSSSDVSEDYDYRAFTYVGATQSIDTIIYKTGGSSGTTVATQTFAYDGSNRLASITKT